MESIIDNLELSYKLNIERVRVTKKYKNSKNLNYLKHLPTWLTKKVEEFQLKQTEKDKEPEQLEMEQENLKIYKGRVVTNLIFFVLFIILAIQIATKFFFQFIS